MNEGWLELESDPGLFTLLVQEFGVEGVQVEEIYDLQKPVEGPVYGFIFLFKWIEERRARRKVSIDDEACVRDEGILKEMFFAHQVVPDSCATHALLSILLNSPSDVELGKMLAEFKDFTRNFSPESKGYAIGNMPEIARVHNSHAHPEPPRLPEKQLGGITKTTSGDTFHFVSYVPIRGRLFELDGLKPYPIDHGPWGEKEDWTAKFQRVIAERLENEGGESDIRFNLMAVVSDRLSSYEQKLSTLRTNRQIIQQAIQRLIREEQQKIDEIKRKEKQEGIEETQPMSDPGTSKEGTVALKEEKLEKPLDKSTGMEETQSAKGTMDPPADPLPQGLSADKSLSVPKCTGQDAEDSHRHRHKRKKKKKKKHHKSKKRPPEVILPPAARTPPALDNHNYAKSLPSADDASSASTESEMDTDAASGLKPAESSTSSSESAVSDTVKTETLEPGTKPPKVTIPEASPSGGSELKEVEEAEKPSPGNVVKKVDEKEKGTSHGKEEGIVSKSIKRESSPEKDEGKAPLEMVGKEMNKGESGPGKDGGKTPPEMSRPLTIQTIFDRSATSSYSPFSNCSTDSASEAGSAFNSPIRSLNHSRASSPNSLKVSRFQQWKAGSYADERQYLEEAIGRIERHRDEVKKQEVQEASLELRKRRLDSGGKELRSGLVTSPTVKQPRREDAMVVRSSIESSSEGEGTSPFTPRQLLEMMQNVEDEIQQYEQRIQDEREKRTKYKIDDSRRTHNYDPFLFTFLSMLAEQGKLNPLIEKHSQIKSRQGINKLTRRQSTSSTRSRKTSGDKMKRRNSKNR